MRLLCDQNVAGKYVQAFENHDEFVVSTVAEGLSPDTSDDDFFEHADQCGGLVYNQLHDPPPGDVLDAVMAIDAAYESNQEIIEVVPGNWV